jgi:hypothetical protein
MVSPNAGLVQERMIDDLLEGVRSEGDTGLQTTNTVLDGKWVTLVSMQDGLPRPPIPIAHARRVLRKKRPDGSPAFWIEGMPYQPPEPMKGSIKCMLHPDFDETDGPAGFGRELIESAGLAGVSCNQNARDKKNRDDFANVYQRNRHMLKKHPGYYRQIQDLLAERERKAADEQRIEDRDFLRQQQAAIMALASGATPANFFDPTAGAEAPPLPLADLNRAALQRYADAHEISYDTRWGEDRLRTEIETAS